MFSDFLGSLLLRKNQNAGIRVSIELGNLNRVGPKQLGDVACGTIANAEENKLRWMPEYQTSLMKVGILGYDGVTVLLGKRPDKRIAGLHESIRLDVC